MRFYALTKKNEEDFTPPVFFAGQNDEEEAIGLFTTGELARQYLDAAQWQETDEVAELEPIDLLAWMIEAYSLGTQYVAINPRHEANDEQSVLVLEDELQQLADTLASAIRTAS